MSGEMALQACGEAHPEIEVYELFEVEEQVDVSAPTTLEQEALLDSEPTIEAGVVMAEIEASQELVASLLEQQAFIKHENYEDESRQLRELEQSKKQQITELERDIEQIRVIKDRARKQISAEMSELKDIKSRASELSQIGLKLDNQQQEVDMKLSQLEQDCNKQQTAIDQLQSELATAYQEFQNADEVRRKYRNRQHENEKSYAGSIDKASHNEALHHASAADRNRSRADRAEKRQRIIQPYIDKLNRQLGAVENKLEVAQAAVDSFIESSEVRQLEKQKAELANELNSLQQQLGGSLDQSGEVAGDSHNVNETVALDAPEQVEANQAINDTMLASFSTKALAEALGTTLGRKPNDKQGVLA